MIVDMYTHFMPPQLLKSIESLGGRSGLAKRMGTPEMHNIEARLRAMDAFDDYRQVISLGSPPIESMTTPEQGLEFARVANDGLAEIVHRHPDRFPGFVAALPFHDSDSNLAELQRAVETLGARGIQVYTNVNGRPLDDPEFDPVFRAMARYDLPIWLHPSRTAEAKDYAAEKLSRFEMWWCFGWPYETSVAMSRLALSGVFDRYPKLKIITHHLGGMVPYFDMRIEAGMAVLGTRTPNEDYSGVLRSLKKPLIEYLHMFYADTALFGASRGLACGLDFFGAEHVVFATDAPFGPVTATRDAIAQLPISAAQRDAICYRNAERLMNLRIA